MSRRPVRAEPRSASLLGSRSELGAELFERLVAVRRLGDGSVPVADQGASEIRWFTFTDDLGVPFVGVCNVAAEPRR